MNTIMRRILLSLFIMVMTMTSAHSAVVTERQRDIAAIASQTAKGDLDGLKISLAKSLDDGMTVNEVKEVIVHSYAYCGFPRAIRGLQTLVAVLDERKAQGISDNWGREASPIKSKKSKYERGRNILENLTQGTDAKSSPLGGDKRGASPKPAYAQLSPEIEVFLKEHLFCDLFERDVLTYQERELATVAVIASLGKGVEPMLRSHIAVALRIGVKPETLRCAFSLIERNVGKSEAD